MNRISAVLASFIKFPDIDPLRSNKKMYYPFTLSISTYRSLWANAAIYASFKFKEQNLGIKETITVVFVSVLPTVKLGS